eukprot:440726-Rhodomonas_salina.1
MSYKRPACVSRQTFFQRSIQFQRSMEVLRGGLRGPETHSDNPAQPFLQEWGQMSSAPQSEQKNFKDVLVASLGATVPPPVVKLRLTTEDVARADLRQPGTLTKLLKQLNRPQQPHQQKRMSRGSACQRCRLMKRRCDGRSPCISCILS